ncbi:MAG TPA: hypothetical protein DCM08_14335 [Microscillaceae bacterium]|nr:hypothetical protein [Microscillaceae bacterium]
MKITKSYRRLNLWVFASLVLIGIALYVGFLLPTLQIKQKGFRLVQQKTWDKLSRLQSQQSTVNQFLAKQPSFAELLSFSRQIDGYLIVYKGSNLHFWSSQDFIPEWQDAKESFVYKVIERKSSVYLLFRTQRTLQDKTWIALQVVQLWRKYPIDNQYLTPYFDKDIFEGIKVAEVAPPQQTDKGSLIQDVQKKDLFRVTLLDAKIPAKPEVLLFLSVVILALIWGLVISIDLMQHSLRIAYDWVFLLSIFYWFGGRITLQQLQLPQAWFAIPFFDIVQPHQWFAPSLGDAVLNFGGLGFIMWRVFRFFPFTNFYKTIYLWGRKSPQIVTFLLLCIVAGLLVIYWEGTQVLLDLLRYPLNLRQDLQLLPEKIIVVLSLLVWTFIMLYASHCFTRLLLVIEIKFAWRRHFWWLFLLLFIGWYFRGLILPFQIGVCLVVVGLWAMLWFRLPKGIGLPKFSAVMYLLGGALCLTWLLAIAVSVDISRKTTKALKQYAQQFDTENDKLAEKQLATILQLLPTDTTLIGQWGQPLLSKKIIQQILQKASVGNHLENYLLTVSVFDPDGENTEKEGRSNYKELEKQYKRVWYETDNPLIYFIHELSLNPIRRYICFLPFQQKGKNLGYIVLDLKQKRDLAGNVFPLLLSEQKNNFDPMSQSYSYAFFDKERLIYEYGDYGFVNQFDKSLLKNPQLAKSGISQSGFQLLMVESQTGKSIVLAAPVVWWADWYAHFAFFFLITALFSTLFIHKRQQFWVAALSPQKASYAARIQFYFNVAFFLPLILTLVSMLSVLVTNYQQDQARDMMQRAEKSGKDLLTYVEMWHKKELSEPYFEEAVKQLANYQSLDLNIFDAQGKLVVSSQEAIFYQNGFLAPWIHPQAYTMVQGQRKFLVQAEQIGNLAYRAVYVPLYGLEKAKPLGVLQVPFFDSQQDLNRQIAHVFNVVVGVFAFVLILLMLFSQIVGQAITQPLYLLRQKMSNTTFSKRNEPLVWDTPDEIGTLVGEYNRMLVKLEESRATEAQNQKETAWREMAKQVAHEIKNPLTPMKLTLQSLQMRLQQQNDEVQHLFERPVESLLTQIDILDDIATSFSAFAKMPIPISERFDVAAVLRETENLYKSNKDVSFRSDISKGKFFVRGDAKLMGRIFTNLILNAIQAVPRDRSPEVSIKLAQVDKNVFIEVKDNGLGIDEALREKIFVPNFTTKEEGSGIGLAVAKRGVEHAGGRIWFDTVPEVGTSFYVEIPLIE